MTEYIEREEINKAMKEVCDDPSCPMHVAAEIAQIIDCAPAADVAPVVHGAPVTKTRTELLTGYHEEIGVFAADGSNLYRKNMVHTDIPYDHCPVCGAVLCSRWHNFCGKCGARMDGAAE